MQGFEAPAGSVTRVCVECGQCLVLPTSDLEQKFSPRLFIVSPTRAPALSSQRLAGYEDLQTTLGYMHLAKGETERAIRLLDEPFIASAVHGNGNLTATEPYADRNTAG